MNTLIEPHPYTQNVANRAAFNMLNTELLQQVLQRPVVEHPIPPTDVSAAQAFFRYQTLSIPFFKRLILDATAEVVRVDPTSRIQLRTIAERVHQWTDLSGVLQSAEVPYIFGAQQRYRPNFQALLQLGKVAGNNAAGDFAYAFWDVQQVAEQ
jgi:hypothetical protein